jgi:hypothetical protein
VINATFKNQPDDASVGEIHRGSASSHPGAVIQMSWESIVAFPREAVL